MQQAKCCGQAADIYVKAAAPP